MDSKVQTEDLNTALKHGADLVNQTLADLLESMPIADCVRPVVRYAIEGPGKRIRAILVLWSCRLICDQITNPARMAAAAIEMVHTYSLIHDDLPAMDNDDIRRGRPTCHKAFDEASAILAGDALLTLAFEVLATRIQQPSLAVRLISQLASAAGPDGMIAGQLADLQAAKNNGDLQMLQYIHTNKTAKMFMCSTVMGGLCGGAKKEQLRALAEYGKTLGMVFQITDDLLDVTSSSLQLGKTAGKDQKAGKLTYPALVGIQEARQIASRLTDQAAGYLQPFGQKTDLLVRLAWRLLDRTR